MKRMDTYRSWGGIDRLEATLHFIHAMVPWYYDRQRKIQDNTKVQIVIQAKKIGSCCYVPPIFQSRINMTFFYWNWLDQSPGEKRKMTTTIVCVCVFLKEGSCTVMMCSLEDFFSFFSLYFSPGNIYHWGSKHQITAEEGTTVHWSVGLQFIIMLHIVSLLATLAHLENIRPITIADHLKTTGRQEM